MRQARTQYGANFWLLTSFGPNLTFLGDDESIRSTLLHWDKSSQFRTALLHLPFEKKKEKKGRLDCKSWIARQTFLLTSHPGWPSSYLIILAHDDVDFNDPRSHISFSSREKVENFSSVGEVSGIENEEGGRRRRRSKRDIEFRLVG